MCFLLCRILNKTVLSFGVITFFWLCGFSQSRVNFDHSQVDLLKGAVDSTYKSKSYKATVSKAQQLLEVAYKQDDWETYDFAFTKNAYSLYYLSDFKSIISSSNEQIELLLKKENQEETIAKLYNWIGFAAYYTGEQDLALQSNLKTIRIYEDLKEPELARSAYANVGISYTMQADYDQAKKYLIQAEHFANEENDQILLKKICTNLGRAYWASGENDLALKYYYRLEEYQGMDFDLAMNLIDCHLKVQNIFEVKKLLKDIEPQINSAFDSLRYFRKHAVLGNINNSKNKMNYIDQAIEISKRLDNSNSRSVSKSHIIKAQFLIEDKMHQESEEHFIKALHLLDSTFVDRFLESNEIDQLKMPLENAPWIMECLFGLAQNASAMFQKGQFNQNNLLKYHTLCFDVIDYIRLNFSEENSSLLLSEYAHKIYANAISFALKELKINGENPILQNLVLASLERSRSFSLTSNLNEIRAKEMANIPDSLLHKEQTLLDSITQMKLNKTNESEIFKTQRNLYELRAIYRNHYPRFYELSFQKPNYTIDELRNKLDDDYEGYLYFFQSDSMLSKVFISKNSFYSDISNVNDSIYQYVNLYNRHLNNPLLSLQTNHHDSTFAASAHNLYTWLFNDFVDLNQYKQLNILASGITHGITFESLLSEPYNGSISFSTEDLQYLIEDLAITYKYSAFIESSTSTEFNFSNNFIGFAPSFESGEKNEYRTCSDGALSSLKFNSEEVSAISNIMNGQKVISEDASKTRFLETVKTTRYIHLATHACAEDHSMDDHKIYFSNDEYLMSSEIYNIQSPTEFLVLSACETGRGKTHSTEGVMHLARAFSYAGISSVCMSLWSLPDYSTSQIMTYFYANLMSKMSKSEALRIAKLKYINESNPTKKHPHYWAAMILTGDDESIVIRKPFKKWHLILIIASIISIFFLLRVFKKE